MNPSKLVWRCRRGMKELDALLLNYLHHQYGLAGSSEQAMFIKLLEESDDHLWRYFYRNERPKDLDLEIIVRSVQSQTSPLMAANHNPLKINEPL